MKQERKIAHLTSVHSRYDARIFFKVAVWRCMGMPSRWWLLMAGGMKVEIGCQLLTREKEGGG